MNRLLGGMRTVARAIRRHKIVAVLSVLTLAVGASIVVPRVVDAAPNPAPPTATWLNRAYLVGSDGVNYFDGNTFDNIFEYIEQNRPECPNKIVFTIPNNAATFRNVDFFYGDGSNVTPKILIGDPYTTGSGQKACNYPERGIGINSNNNARRITWYRNNNDQIINILNGVSFSRKGDYKGTARYFRDSEVADAGNSCPDMILQHATRTMNNSVFGSNEVPGSSILFSVVKDDDLGRDSETYNIDSEPNSIGDKDCQVRSDAMFRSRSGEYAQLPQSATSNSDDEYFLASGLDQNGQTRSSGDYEDDAFITFVGTIANLPKDGTDTPIQTPADPGGSNGDQIDEQVCKGGALGWIVCPVVSAIQAAINQLRDLMQYFLTVNPLPIGSGPIYDSWSNIRNFSNIAFAIAFFIIIFSQATSLGISNYGIKRLLPRLILIAIGTNISYFICSAMIDAFNILGVGVTALFAAANGGSFGTVDVSNGAGLIFTTGLTAGIAWAFASGAIVQIFPLIATAFIGFFITFVILIARQALIILLVVFSPIAFVAGLLPGTQNWFRRWFDTFTTLLVMYPLIMALFAAARLASAILSAAAGG